MKINKMLLLGLIMLFSAVTPKALAADTIKIGANLEMTGGSASFGASATNAAKLAINEYNAKGGFKGKKLELKK